MLHAVKDEPFYKPICKNAIPTDPYALQAGLHQVIKQTNDYESTKTQYYEQKSIYYTDEYFNSDLVYESQFKIFYSNNCNPIFKTRIMK